MAIKLEETADGRILEVSLTGKIVKEDYDTFVPEVEQSVKKRGKLRMLVLMHDFHGWTIGAAWEDTKFALHHFNDIDRLAMVGETRWQKMLTSFGKPFTAAAVRYFDLADLDEARAWLDQPELKTA